MDTSKHRLCKTCYIQTSFVMNEIYKTLLQNGNTIMYLTLNCFMRNSKILTRVDRLLNEIRQFKKLDK